MNMRPQLHHTCDCCLQVFGCDTKSYFNGTAFRFPLRTADMAAHSRISHQQYSAAKVKDLLAQLTQETHLILLFLKCVTRIDILHWPENATEPTLCFSCSLGNVTKQLEAERGLFLKASASTSSPAGQDAFISTHRLDIDSRYQQPLDSWIAPDKQGGQDAAGPGACWGTASRSFLVTQHKAAGKAAQMAAEMSKQLGVPLVPWAAVAAELSPRSEANSGLDGRAFCFLPLPTKTGNPCVRTLNSSSHINYFCGTEFRYLYHVAVCSPFLCPFDQRCCCCCCAPHNSMVVCECRSAGACQCVL